MSGGNFKNALQGILRFLSGETKSPVDHEGTGEDIGCTFGSEQMFNITHQGSRERIRQDLQDTKEN